MKPCEYIKNLIADREPTDSFKYMLLDRMKSDCNYYLGNGNRCAKYLWSDSPEEHIANMKALWNSFPDDAKPEWLTMEQIEEYEKAVNKNTRRYGTMDKFFFRIEHKKNRISELFARRSDGKLFKVSCRNSGKWEVLEDRGRDGTFSAVLNDSCLMWFPIEPFNSMIQACRWLKENIDNLL